MDIDTNKYDISAMPKDIHNHVYLPTSADFSNIISDVLSLNFFLEKCLTLSSEFPISCIDKEDIVFFSDASNPDVREFCFFILNPQTPSGKQPKYPLKLHFYCRGKNDESYIKSGDSLIHKAKDCIFGSIEFTNKLDFGKIHIVVWNNGKSYTVDIRSKKDNLYISKIHDHFNNKTLYVNK